jgi:hypothetical protein
MHEPLLEQIRVLDRARRRWRAIAIGLGLALFLVTLGGAGSNAIMWYRLRHTQMVEMEMLARAEAERAQAEAARAQAETQRLLALQEEARLKAADNP